MLDFLSSYWIWILFIGAMLWMHLGHGGHGGHGGCGGHQQSGTPDDSRADSRPGYGAGVGQGQRPPEHHHH